MCSFETPDRSFFAQTINASFNLVSSQCPHEVNPLKVQNEKEQSMSMNEMSC